MEDEGGIVGTSATDRETRRRSELALVDRLVDGLREQAHEYANRLHGIGGLLALDDLPGARQVVADVEHDYHRRHDAIAARIGVRSLGGVVMAEASLAARIGVRLTVGEASALDRLPDGADELAVLTLVAGLLRDAVAAVAPQPTPDRWVRLDLHRVDGRTTIAVLTGPPAPDHGPLVPEVAGLDARVAVHRGPEGISVTIGLAG
ncbi:sensor histidine kinase [Patulibacter defluvii]|uniref:sensor histidine kinase n=1 Tax=Patulibacter defluvii TaxID=3095358 RepID=UPI002A763A78|nr:hypothetical protein [Patulibacter sp. DM4]